MTQTIIVKKVARNIPVAHDLVVLHLKDDTNLNRKSLVIEEVGHVKNEVDHGKEEADHVKEEADRVSEGVDHVKEEIVLGIGEVDHVIEEVDHMIEEVHHVIEEVDHAVEEADLARKSPILVAEIIAEVCQGLCHEIDPHIEEKTQNPLKRYQGKALRKTLRIK